MSSPGKSKSDIRTRKAILHALKTEGPADAKTLAERQGVTAMAVRQHLYQLHDEKLVTYSEQPQTRGRPAKMWRLTGNADQYFPDAHAELTSSLIDAMRAAFGNDGLERIIASRTASQIEAYQKQLAGARSLPARIKKLARIRTREGYMAESVRQADGSYHLIENHCPVCTAAKSCRGLCAAELTLFQSILGEDVGISRADHIIEGARRCVYVVRREN